MYLLDTTVVSNLVNLQSAGHAAAAQFMVDNQDREKRLCVVTVAELEFGLHVLQARQPAPDPARLAEVARRVAEAQRLADQLVITRHVALEHARLRAAYAKLVAPKALQSMSLKSKPVELWHEDWRASNLQADENDLWIAATALAHDLTLVARDSGFEQIQKAAPTLKLQLLP